MSIPTTVVFDRDGNELTRISVNWNATLDAGGVLVSDKVTLEFEASAIRTEAN